MENDKKICWKIIGNKYNPNDPRRPQPDQEIEIPEEDSSIHPIREAAFGKAIDAKLAVFLIKELFDLLKKKFHINLSGEQTEKENNNATCDEKCLKELLRVSNGVTFDKKILLKILSQPKCEGLRLYLCLRNNESDFEKGYDQLDLTNRLSLVLVGVDGDNYDLGYKAAEFGSDIANKSLIAEYGHPPGSVTEPFPFIDDAHYWLLNMAKKLSDENHNP